MKQQERYPEVNTSYVPDVLGEAENQPGAAPLRDTPVSPVSAVNAS